MLRNSLDGPISVREADVIEGRVGRAVLGGSGSGTDSLESADG